MAHPGFSKSLMSCPWVDVIVKYRLASIARHAQGPERLVMHSNVMSNVLRQVKPVSHIWRHHAINMSVELPSVDFEASLSALRSQGRG